MPTLISLIRHGVTTWNTNGKFQGNACVPLNEEGQRQTELLAAFLAVTGRDATALYASDMLRTRQTAEVIAGKLGLAIKHDVRLREINLGEWQGLTLEEVVAWDGERHQRIMADHFNSPRPGGESGRQVAERALSAVEAIVAAHPGEHVLAVTHGGTIRNLLDYLKLKATKDHILNTSVTRLIHDPDKADSIWILDAFNQINHLNIPTSVDVNTEQDV